MEKRTEGNGMIGQIKRKFPHLKQVKKLLKSFQFLNGGIIETLAVTDFRFKFRIMEWLITRAVFRSKA